MSPQTQPPSHRMLLVLGMHRSGTSALAGVLAEAGVDFGDRLMPPAPDNPKGFFEHADIWRLDHALLESLGSAWDDPLPLPDGWRDTPAYLQTAAQAYTVLARDFATAPLSGIKDPRMCRLMSAWRPWLAAAHFDTNVILALREPADVIASLGVRDHLPADQAAWIWLRHVLEAERDTRGMPRVVVAYENLMRDWRTELDRVARGLDVAWRGRRKQGDPLDTFLESGLRHHFGALAEVGLPEPLRRWVEQACSAFAGAATDIAAEPDRASLDRVAAELAAADHVSAPGAAVLRVARNHQHELQRKLEWSDREREGLTAGNQALQENLDRHVKALADAKAGNQALQENLDRHVKALADAQAGNQALQENLDRHVKALADAQAVNAWLRGEVARLSADIAALYASRSWRITRPLRGVMRLAHGDFSVLTHRAAAMAAPASPPRPTPANLPSAASQPIRAPTVPESDAMAEAALAPALSAATGPRVLIVTPDILGPIRNGGIGTAFAALAEALATAGRAVTILYTLGGHTEGGEGVAHWKAHYAQRGIRFIPIRLEKGEPVLDAPWHAWRAYRVYLWLKQHQADYDIAYFPEWKGEAYYALQAKRLTLDFARLRIVIVTHSSTTWAESGNYVVPQRFDDLLLEFLERRCVAMADAIVSPSQYMLDWMRSWGWCWHARTHVIQNLMPDAPSPPMPDAGMVIHEWVFFGRLERRKGLLIFLAALAQMPAEVRARIQVTFLGKAIHTPHFDSDVAIRGKLDSWTLPPKLITNYDRDQALAYLAEPGRVAIVASLVENSPYTVLECITRRVPFIAADVGGIGELVHADDCARVLFRPNPAGLAKALLALDGAAYRSPRAAVPQAHTLQCWLALQDELLDEIPEPAEPAAPALHVTVCLVHYDRPALLAQALESLRQQTYPHFDVVLVDDGSRTPEAHAYLDGLADEFAWRGWTLVRQANGYLGAARNHAVQHARGDYVLFMDDDNLAKPNELAVFARAAQASGADILTTVSDIFSDADGVPGADRASRQLWIPLGKAVGLGVFRNVFGDANALIRRQTFLDLGGFTEDYGVGHEDWEFFAHAVLAGANLQLVPEPLFWYRVDASSMLRKGDADVDHARSLRPYYQRLPTGIGAALAYAAWMHHRPVDAVASVALPTPAPASSAAQLAVTASVARGHRLWLVVTGPFRPHVRARFREVLQQTGWRGIPHRLAVYVGLGRRGV